MIVDGGIWDGICIDLYKDVEKGLPKGVPGVIEGDDVAATKGWGGEVICELRWTHSIALLSRRMEAQNPRT